MKVKKYLDDRRVTLNQSGGIFTSWHWEYSLYEDGRGNYYTDADEGLSDAVIKLHADNADAAIEEIRAYVQDMELAHAAEE